MYFVEHLALTVGKEGGGGGVGRAVKWRFILIIALPWPYDYI